MKPENFSIDDFIESLRGTCKSIDEALPEGMSYEDLTPQDFDAIDQSVFECSQCNWWCETSELVEQDGENYCSDCAAE